jgi:hypothetical protein
MSSYLQRQTSQMILVKLEQNSFNICDRNFCFRSCDYAPPATPLRSAIAGKIIFGSLRWLDVGFRVLKVAQRFSRSSWRTKDSLALLTSLELQGWRRTSGSLGTEIRLAKKMFAF